MTLMAATDRTRNADTGEAIKLVFHHTSDGAVDFTLYDQQPGGVFVPLNLSGLDRATAFFWYQDTVFTSFDLDFTIIQAAAGRMRLGWTNVMTATLPNVFESVTAQIVFEFAGEAVKVLDVLAFLLPTCLQPVTLAPAVYNLSIRVYYEVFTVGGVIRVGGYGEPPSAYPPLTA